MKSMIRKFRIVAFIWACLFSFTLAFAQETELVVQTGHSSAILSVKFSPDGKYIVTGSSDQTAKLWDVATGREIRTFSGFDKYINWVDFSPDGRYIITGSGEKSDQTKKLWDIITGDEIHTFNEAGKNIYFVAFDPDNKYIIAVYNDKTAKLWNIATGEVIYTFKTLREEIHVAEFAPDGKYIITGSINNIQVWDVEALNEVYSINGFNYVFNSIRFHSEGRCFFAVEADNIVKILDVATGKEIRVFSEYNYSTAIEFSPGGKYLVNWERERSTGGRTILVKLWDVATGMLIQNFHYPSFSRFLSLDFSSNDRYIVINSYDIESKVSDIMLWDISTGAIAQKYRHSQEVFSVDFSPDSKSIVTCGWDHTVRLWDVASGKLIQTFGGYSGEVLTAKFSPDKKYIVTINWDSTAKLWDLTTGRESKIFIGHSDVITSVDIKSDSKYIITGSWDQTAILWSIEKGEQIHIFKGHNMNVTSVGFSPDGKYILTGSDDKFAIVWDIATGMKVHTFGEHPFLINSVNFSPDSKIAATACSNTITLWDVIKGQEIRTLEPHIKTINSFSFSLDGKYIVTASEDNIAKLCNLKSGLEIRTFRGHTKPVTSVSFSPDSKYIVTGSKDNTAKLWEVLTGTEIRTFTGHSYEITYVEFSHDGKYLITGSRDATTKIWNISTGKELVTLISIGENDWAVTTPDGLFDASEGAEKYIHFVRGLEVIELNQLKERYYEPGLLAKIMGYNDEPLLTVKALAEAKLYPEIELNEPIPGDQELEIHLKNRGGGIGRVIIFINDKEITADARDASADPNTDELELAVQIGEHPYLVPGEDNIIEVKAFNADGYLSSRNVRVIYKAPAKAKVEPPTLWGIVAGVSEYHGDEIDLRFAAKDAVDMAQALNIGAHRLFGAERTYVALLTTEKIQGAIYPNKDNLFQAFSDVAHRAKSTDILVVYLAGHGVTYGGHDGDYYYLTAEASSGDLKDEAIRQQRAISSQELTEQIKKIPALKQVLILDTCHSGRFSEDMTKGRVISSSQIRAFERMKDRTGLHILAGAAADAVAYESSSYGQGILTYSLLLGMRGAALKDDEYIDISLLFQYSADHVPELAKNIGGIQKPNVYGGTSFYIGRLISEDKSRIPLAQVRPLVLRTFFSNDAPPFDDNLGLNKLLNEALRDISARGKSASLVFVDSDEFPQAYKLSGRYKITDGKVTVTVYLLVGKETKGNFQVKGNVEDTEQLVVDILTQAEKWISN